MSEIAVPAVAPATVPPARVSALTWVRRIGYVVLGLQLIGFLTWSAIEYSRFALTWDYAFDHQAWYLIAHGNLDPYSSLWSHLYWHAHGEFIEWPLALLYWVWPHDLMMQWIQDFGVATASAVMFTWICELASRRHADGPAAWFAVVGLVLLVANPWTWQSVSFDYHIETVALSFLVLLIRDLANSRRRAWIWMLPIFLCGDVAATYVAAAGFGAALAYRSSRVQGLAMMVAAAVAYEVLALASANLGSSMERFGYLAGGAAGGTPSTGALVMGIFTHPLLVMGTLASKSTDIWGNLAASGLLGVCFVPLLPVVSLTLLESGLWPGQLLAEPGFQNVIVYFLVPAGTVAVLSWLHQRHRILALALSCAVVTQVLGWAAVFAPRIPGEWLRVPVGTAATLAATQAMIPPNAEVIASQGVVGRFSDRARVVALSRGVQLLPVHGETWFVIVPFAGIELQSVASAEALIGELAGPLGATLVTQANGVWLFRWDPPPGTTTVTVPGELAPLEAWILPGAAGRSVMHGPVSTWHAAATGAEGYVADHLQWLVPTGHYVAEVTLATSGPVNVEVWNDTGNVLLARRTIVATGEPAPVTLAVDALTAYQPHTFSGWGPFRASFVPPPPGQLLEVRVWSPGRSMVNVYSAELGSSAKGG
jgi:Predicted membrane protein (DUF2079)